ncbi:hypothetical protein IWW39_002272 [Coemansia spiralis]|uniref:Uncharacterized protein n=1 Tax=Coemansia spiralis TaxID=417178 RepID=A0A9W8GGC3_9FUNG|nr:hypothetical protein IWW39_002272 [Coemansia spiralis]
MVANKLIPNYHLGGWYADANMADGSYRIAYRISSPLHSLQVASPATGIQYSTRTDLMSIQIIREPEPEPEPEPVDNGDDFWARLSEELSPVLLRFAIAVFFLKKTGIWKFVCQTISNADQPETKELALADTGARVAFVAASNAYPQALLVRHGATNSGVFLFRKIVISSGMFLLRGILVCPGELFLREIVVSSDVFLLREIAVSSGALLLRGNVVSLDMLCRCNNVVLLGAFLLGDNATSSGVLLHRDNAACLDLARHRDKVISTTVLPQRNVIDSPRAPLLHDFTAGPSLLLQSCIATSSGALQLPIVIADVEEPQRDDQEADAALVETAAIRRILRLAPGLAASSDTPTSIRPCALSAPGDYTANRSFVIVLRPVGRWACPARSIPMSRLIDFTSGSILQQYLSPRASVGTMLALGDACGEAVGSSGAITTSLGLLQQAPSSFLSVD